jgi:hypothetical protein
MGIVSLVSSKVAAGITILADQFNKLWTDLTQNHDHSTGQGGTVDHKDLSESGVMSGVYHTHANIENHMNGLAGSYGDAGGGDAGVHGLAASAKVAGSIGGQYVMQADTDTLDATGACAVSFSPVFDSIVSVVATYAAARTDVGNPRESSVIYLTNVSATGFTAHTADPDQYANKAFNWIAIGTKA